MQKSEHIGLNIFEQADKMRLGAFNENWRLLDDLLRVSGEDIAGRAKFASGSYVGTVAGTKRQFTDYGNKVHTGNYDQPKSSSADTVVAVVDFEPRVLLLAAGREAEYAWSGTGYTTEGDSVNGYYDRPTSWSISAYETQSLLLVAAQGIVAAPCFYHHIGPEYAGSGVPVGSAGGAKSEILPTLVNSGYPVYGGEYSVDRKPWGMYNSRVTTENNGDGTWTVKVKGADMERFTENLADIQGMTYHWVALG